MMRHSADDVQSERAASFGVPGAVPSRTRGTAQHR